MPNHSTFTPPMGEWIELGLCGIDTLTQVGQKGRYPLYGRSLSSASTSTFPITIAWFKDMTLLLSNACRLGGLARLRQTACAPDHALDLFFAFARRYSPKHRQWKMAKPPQRWDLIQFSTVATLRLHMTHSSISISFVGPLAEGQGDGFCLNPRAIFSAQLSHAGPEGCA